MERTDIYLRDILESCDLIVADLAAVEFDAFRGNRLLQDAIIRRFEIIGEAVKRVPQEVRAEYPDVPWQQAAGFRDVLIHDYPEVVIDEVYYTAKHDLPSFRDTIARIIASRK